MTRFLRKSSPRQKTICDGVLSTKCSQIISLFARGQLQRRNHVLDSCIPLSDPSNAAFSFDDNTKNQKARAVAPLGNQAFLLTHLRSDKFHVPPLPMETPQCKAQYSWQLSSPAFLSVCNTVHEQGFAGLGGGRAGGSTQTTTPVAKRIASGTWRDAWTLEDYRARGIGHCMSNTSNNTSTKGPFFTLRQSLIA